MALWYAAIFSTVRPVFAPIFFFLWLFLWLSFFACTPTPGETDLRRKAADAELKAASPADFQSVAQLYFELYQAYPAADSANAALLKSARALSAARQPAQAMERFDLFRQTFPKDKDAPLSLFMAGFIANNELADTVKARTVFEQFIREFPSHELVSSAAFELSNLGKAPDKIMLPSPEQDTSSHHGTMHH